MKKQQRPFELEENDPGSSEISDDDILRELDGEEGFEELLDDGLDEEEIIDLEDVVEDMDDLDDLFKVENGEGILEADSILDLTDPGSERVSTESAISDDDLFKDLGISEEISIGDDELLEVRVVDEQDSGRDDVVQAEDKDDILDIDTLLDLTRELSDHGEQGAVEKQPVKTLPEPVEEDILDSVASETALAEGQSAVETPPEQLKAEDAPHSEVSLEDAILQIEARLVEMVQQLVEAKLPGIVREVLREEIEQLRKEPQL